MRFVPDRGAVNSLMVAGAAAIVAAVALGVSIVALFAVRSDESVAAGPTPTPSVVETPDPTVSRSIEPTDSPSPTEDLEASSSGPYDTDGPLPSVDAQYTTAYEDVKITLSKSSGSSYRGFDLDQPLVNPEPAAADGRLNFSDVALQFDSDRVAIAKSPQVTPAECASAIQLSPSSTTVKVSEDLVLCTVTNGRGALNEPERLKMVRIIVNSVADDGATIVSLTAWELPR